MKTFFFHVSNTVNPPALHLKSLQLVQYKSYTDPSNIIVRLHRQASSSNNTSTNKPYHFELADLITGVFRSHRYVVAT